MLQPPPNMEHLLIHEGLLEKSKIPIYQNQAKEANMTLSQYLTRFQIVPPDKIALSLSRQLGVPWIDLDRLDVNESIWKVIDTKLIEKYHIAPLFIRGKNLYLGIDDPAKQSFFSEIQFCCGLQVHAVIVETDKLNHFVKKIMHAASTHHKIDPVRQVPAQHISEQDDAPIVRFVNKILLDAIHLGASDIHIEPYETVFRIRYRRDGILTEVATPSLTDASRITARIKILAQLDIAERRLPQDGRFNMQLSKTRAIDFRVNSCPTISGEKLVLRILDSEITRPEIETLGLNLSQIKLFRETIHKPQGMILVTGPTGSGKTMTLYTALHILNTEAVNISTAEDPVECKLSGINQVPINPKAGLHFADTLRAFLRQDPDIIMVGEIRDRETADIAIKASQTGHLVLSTLHTNSAAETLIRLKNMGIPVFNIAHSLHLIIAQRLARKLCEACKQIRKNSSPSRLIAMGFSENDIHQIIEYQATGCSQCNNGYKGRTGLYELLPVSQSIEQIIMRNGNALDILQQAQQEGMITMYQSGLEKIKLGLTTIEEVNRVTME